MSSEAHRTLADFLSLIARRYSQYHVNDCQEGRTYLVIRGLAASRRVILTAHLLCEVHGKRCDRIVFYIVRNQLLIYIVELKGLQPDFHKIERQLQNCIKCIDAIFGQDIDSLTQNGVKVKIVFVTAYTSRSFSVPSVIGNIMIPFRGRNFRVVPAYFGTPITDCSQHCRYWPSAIACVDET